MKRVIRCRTDTNNKEPIDLNIDKMIKDKTGRKLFGKIMSIPYENIESYLTGCADVCQLTGTFIPWPEEIYNSILENGIEETMKTLKRIWKKNYLLESLL